MWLVLSGLLLAPGRVDAQATFKDPLDYPAIIQSHVADRPLMAVAKAGGRLIAAGLRGLIVVSDDQGMTWRQSTVPVQSDLLAVMFPTATAGWAVGHDGVILHSHDGGSTWQKQLDGRIAAESFKKFYATYGDADEASLREIRRTVESNFRAGPALPYLDVWFEDEQRGYAIGSYGMIVGTVDGGKNWEPWLHRIDNETSLNLNSIRGIAGAIYIAGEHGMVYKLDRGLARFKGTATDYAGSFFGITGNADSLLAFGLRGVVYRSSDAGASWQAVVTNSTESTITAGAYRGTPAEVALVTDTGEIIIADAAAGTFRTLTARRPMLFTGAIFPSPSSLLLVGLKGVRLQLLDPSGP